MKLIPRNYDLFADVFDDMFNSSLTRGVSSIMKTDIHEKDGNYVVDVELPGYKKEDIGIDLKNGYLSISHTRPYIRSEPPWREALRNMPALPG